MTDAARDRTRLRTLDVVRGFAVLGILLLNILSFGLPSDAYDDPRVYGSAQDANFWTWAIVFVVAEGKMRGLFSMLFGASTILIAERAQAAGENPARVHLARMAVLALIGMIHAYFVWSGDILVSYAVAGTIVFAAWRLPVSKLSALAAALMLVQLATGFGTWLSVRHFEARATAAGASPALRQDWAEFRAAIAPSPAAIHADLADYRGDWATVSRARVAATLDEQTLTLPATLPETLSMMLLGMALYRSGFLAGRWPRRRYRQVMVYGYGFGLALTTVLAGAIVARGFDPVFAVLADPVDLVLLRPLVALAHAAAIVLLVGSGRAAWLVDRVAAAGRMAFSNYIGTSLICTALFYGYGLGWYGHLERWQLYGVVAGVWALILFWSAPWFDRFAYGPFEWVWRSMARGRAQPFLRST